MRSLTKYLYLSSDGTQYKEVYSPDNLSFLSNEMPKSDAVFNSPAGTSGIMNQAARADHVHPYVEDTSKMNKAGGAFNGNISANNVTATDAIYGTTGVYDQFTRCYSAANPPPTPRINGQKADNTVSIYAPEALPDEPRSVLIGNQYGALTWTHGLTSYKIYDDGVQSINKVITVPYYDCTFYAYTLTRGDYFYPDQILFIPKNVYNRLQLSSKIINIGGSGGAYARFVHVLSNSQTQGTLEFKSFTTDGNSNSINIKIYGLDF